MRIAEEILLIKQSELRNKKLKHFWGIRGNSYVFEIQPDPEGAAKAERISAQIPRAFHSRGFYLDYH